MSKQIYIDSNGNEIQVSGTVNSADMLPLEAGSSKMTSAAIGTLSSLTTTNKDSLVEAVNEVDGKVSTKQNSNVLNIVKTFTSGTSTDAINSLITEYGKTNMMFAFNVSGVGYFFGALTFFNDNLGSGYIILSATNRFWVVVYSNGTITLTEKT